MADGKQAPESDDDRYETFVRLFTQYERDIWRFIRSLVPNSTDTDDVLQQSAIVLWRKFEQFDTSTNFMKWACVVARYEALAYRRKIARDRLVFSEDILTMMADEGIEELKTRSAEKVALTFCLGKLNDQQRGFLTLAYTSGVKTKDLAAEAGSTAAAYYMKLKRLRHQLQGCIEKNLHHSASSEAS